MGEELKRELESLERQGWDSLCDGTGHEFYGRTMTEDGVMVLANGMVMTREQVVAALRDAPTWAAYDLADVHIVQLGADAAALVYVGTAHRDDGSSITAAMTSSYVRTGEHWRLAVYTQTPVAG